MVQETFLAAMKARETYTGNASVKTWLVGILKHKIIDFIRKQIRESTVDDIIALSDATVQSDNNDPFDADGRWIQPPKEWGSPDQTLNNRQFIEAFEYCLRRLKPSLAHIFSLKELSGESNENICTDLGISASNCGVMLYRARMGLRRCLEIQWPGGHQEENS